MVTEFAERHGLKIRKDECGDLIIPGTRGHLYFDGIKLCAMWIESRPINRSTLAGLGGKAWQGDITENGRGRRVRDAWVQGIPPESYHLAIRLVGAKRRRVMSPARLEALEKARLASPLIPIRPVQDGPLLT